VAQIERVVPAPKPGGQPAKDDRRGIVDALLYITSTGCQWRMMPKDLLPCRIVYWFFMRWKMDGIFDRLNDLLRGDLRAAHGRGAIIGSQRARTTQRGPHGYGAGKGVNGRKRTSSWTPSA